MYILTRIKNEIKFIISRYIYKNEIDLQFYKSIYDESNYSDCKPETELKTVFITEHDNWQVLFPEDFWSRINRLNTYLKKGIKCFALFDTNNNIIGAIWFGFSKNYYDIFTKKKKNIEIKESECTNIYYLKIHPSMAGKGYGYYLRWKFLDMLKAEGKIKYVTSQVNVKNYPSIAVNVKQGGQLFGIVHYKKLLKYNRDITSIFK